MGGKAEYNCLRNNFFCGGFVLGNLAKKGGGQKPRHKRRKLSEALGITTANGIEETEPSRDKAEKQTRTQFAFRKRQHPR